MAAAEEMRPKGPIDLGDISDISTPEGELREQEIDAAGEREEALQGRGIVEEEDMQGEPVMSPEWAIKAANEVLRGDDEALMDAVVKRLVYGFAAAREKAVGAIDFERYGVQVFGYHAASIPEFGEKMRSEDLYLSADAVHDPGVNLSFLIKLKKEEEDGGLSVDQLTGIMMTARRVVSALRIAGVPAQAEFNCPGYVRAHVPLRKFLELVDDCRKAGSVEEVKNEREGIVVATADRARRRAMEEVEAL